MPQFICDRTFGNLFRWLLVAGCGHWPIRKSKSSIVSKREPKSAAVGEPDADGCRAASVSRMCEGSIHCSTHNAVREMRVDPSESACRRRLQTTVSCRSQELLW
jgi:hypothetical protein